MHLDRLVPADAQAARQRLADVMEQMVQRLASIRAVLVQVAQADAATAAARLEADLTHEGELQHRYLVAHDRSLLRSIDSFYKRRQEADAGTPEGPLPDRDQGAVAGTTIPPSPQDPLLTESLLAEKVGASAPKLRNEPETGGPAPEPEPWPEPPPAAFAAAPLIAIVPPEPPTPALVVTAVPAAPSPQSVQQTRRPFGKLTAGRSRDKAKDPTDNRRRFGKLTAGRFRKLTAGRFGKLTAGRTRDEAMRPTNN